jgi:hypothetical protein
MMQDPIFKIGNNLEPGEEGEEDFIEKIHAHEVEQEKMFEKDDFENKQVGNEKDKMGDDAKT